MKGTCLCNQQQSVLTGGRTASTAPPADLKSDFTCATYQHTAGYHCMVLLVNQLDWQGLASLRPCPLAFWLVKVDCPLSCFTQKLYTLAGALNAAGAADACWWLVVAWMAITALERSKAAATATGISGMTHARSHKSTGVELCTPQQKRVEQQLVQRLCQLSGPPGQSQHCLWAVTWQLPRQLRPHHSSPEMETGM